MRIRYVEDPNVFSRSPIGKIPSKLIDLDEINKEQNYDIVFIGIDGEMGRKSNARWGQVSRIIMDFGDVGRDIYITPHRQGK